MFTGRDGELERLLADLSQAVQRGRVVAISAIDGMAGIGKTAFAIHAAHLLAPEFPDGQLYLDLHAHTAGQRPVTAVDALGSLLLCIGVDAQLIPPDVDSRAALWRDRLADRRMLILLDDAAGHEQVRSLLPGTAGCLVLITSRRRLSALQDVQRLTLDTLRPMDAAELFVRMAGSVGNADPAAVAELVELCGCLPLAIGLLAGRLRCHSSWTVRDVADRLRGAQDRLAEMQAENIAVATTFDLSYRDLTPADQRLFRRLGLHPGQEIDAHAAAALDGIGVHEAGRGLDALHNDHLVVEPSSGRYRLHDLIREYARRLAAQDDPAGNDAALDRLLDYYVCATLAANRHFPQRSRPTLPVIVQPAADLPNLGTRESALAWLEAERTNLAACVDHAAARGRHGRAVQLAFAMHSFLRVAGHWDQAVAIHRAALGAARVVGDRLGQAYALNNLSIVRQLKGQYREAIASLSEALTLYRYLGNRLGQANALTDLGRLQYFTGDYQKATACLTEALSVYRDLDDRHGQANALNYLGVVQYLMDDYLCASDSLAEALALYRQLGDRNGQANALDGLGVVQHLRGEHAAAMDTLTEALSIYRTLQHRFGQASVLNNLGLVQQLVGDRAGASGSLNAALTTYRALGNRHGEANVLVRRGIVQRAAGDCRAASESLTEALTTYRALGDRRGQADALNQLGAESFARGCHDDAMNCHREALTLAREIHAPLQEARALEGMGRCLLGVADHAGGVAYLRDALGVYLRIGAPDAGSLAATLRAAPAKPGN